MASKAAFYGTMSLDSKALGDEPFAAIWQKALDSYDEKKLDWGITSVYATESEDGTTTYQISGQTEDGFDDDVELILSGSLNGADTDALYKALSELGLTVFFDFNEFATADDADDALTHETCGIKIENDRPALVNASYEDLPITSARLVDLGFAEESPLDDEELAVMVAGAYPEGPEASDLIDAIEDLRNDAAHDGVFTAAETEDTERFAQELVASYSDEEDAE